MTIPDETLMAYADGELEPAQRAEVETAMAADPTLAERVDRHRALRRKLNAAFDPILMETVPDALVSKIHASTAAVHGAGQSGPAAASASAAAPGFAASGAAERAATAAERGATITDLRRVRAARDAEAKEAAAFARRGAVPRQPWTWFEWAAVAASVALGAVIAHVALNSPDASRIGTAGGHLVAQADLARALSDQLVADQATDAPVQIGLSFKSKSGDTCRTFTVKEQTVLGGLACREGNEWHVQVLANTPSGTTGQGGYKPAGESMPAAVLTAVEQEIEGEALDASGEAAARARGWK